MEILISGKLYLPEKLRKSIYVGNYISKDEVKMLSELATKIGVTIKPHVIYGFLFKQKGIPYSKKPAYNLVITYVRRKNKFIFNFIEYANSIHTINKAK